MRLDVKDARCRCKDRPRRLFGLEDDPYTLMTRHRPSNVDDLDSLLRIVETTYLRVPGLTVRENTERPVTVELGTNELVPLEPDLIVDRVVRTLAEGGTSGQVPPLWDGQAARLIVEVLEEALAS